MMANLYAGLIAGILNIAAIPLFILVAARRGWFDEVNAREIHTAEISRLGGVGIFWSFTATLLLVSFFSRDAAKDARSYWPVGLALLIVHGVGLVDDFKDLRAKLKFAVHLIAALIVVSAGYHFGTIYIPFAGVLELGFWSYPLTVIWIVGVINALNMIDGMDGLSGGISVIAALAFALIFMQRQMGTPAVAALALAGALAGYLFYNFPPARIFMGDSGSTFLGFILALFPLLAAPGQADSGLWFYDGITILLIPIFDSFAAIIRRMRQGLPVMSADKWHLHHKLLHLGMSVRGILAVIYALCMALGLAASSVLYLSPMAHWLVIMVSWFSVGLFFTILHFKKEKSLEQATVT